MFAVGESAATIAIAHLLSLDRVLLVGQDLALAQRQLARPLDDVDLALLVCLAKGVPTSAYAAVPKAKLPCTAIKGSLRIDFSLGER